MGRIDGKIAFITGSGSGIARASARMFAREGASVVIAELKIELGKATEQLICSAGGEELFVETDITNEDSVRNAMSAAIKKYQRLDILHNCAGGSIVEDGSVTEVNMKVWDYTINLDLKGTFLCCRHAIP